MDINMAIIGIINGTKARSAWNNGVKEYAIMLADNLEDVELCELNKADAHSRITEKLLNGAQDWREYSYGGCALIYDGDIAETLCTPSELRRTHNGQRRPNSAESWLDVQARALYQACRLVIKACDEVKDRYVTNEYGTVIDYAVAVSLMDEDIRQELAYRLAPCSNQAFFAAYERAHAEKYGEDDWELSKLNPCY